MLRYIGTSTASAFLGLVMLGLIYEGVQLWEVRRGRSA